MNYKAFGYYTKGYSHIKARMECEDRAACYSDPNGRFFIASVCDGHSDKNCFRSAKGAKFGCESAIDILSKFFQQYLSQPPEDRNILRYPERYELRLKQSLLYSWNEKVKEDLRTYPLTEREKAPLSEQVRACYEANKLLNNIYGTTFLAIGICQEFFMALHIGDGTVLTIYPDGSYQSPLPVDEKSETGSPASLCDSDLLTRDYAFRCAFCAAIPLAALVSSDGIQDCVDSLQFREVMRYTFNRLIEQEKKPKRYFKSSKAKNAEYVKWNYRLNETQMQSLRNCVDFYAAAGHGAEDDCSLAGFYRIDRLLPEVILPVDEVQDMIAQAQKIQEMRSKEYADRKVAMEKTVCEQESLLNEKQEKLDQLSQVLEEYKSLYAEAEDTYRALEQKLQQQRKTLEIIKNNERNLHESYMRKMEELNAYLQRSVHYADNLKKSSKS